MCRKQSELMLSDALRIGLCQGWQTFFRSRANILNLKNKNILVCHVHRGVQYVHWVMHKCIMVKVGGKRNTRKVCKKQVNLCKTGGKRSSEILADENQEIFPEKVTFIKFSSEPENFSKIGGKSETGGKCIMVSGGIDAPACTLFFLLHSLLFTIRTY